ncbi:restriction endonuclease subunit S [Lactobacillus gasseri]|uniref:restriction endonuclease subunit S n=1 Tax=Lactobacillus gasseri TaxID=1596 RepID=UPI003B9F911C
MTKSDDKRVPALRFKGFTDEWEQRKLGEVAEIVGGGTPSTNISEYWNGNINWYSPTEIGSQTFVNSSKKKITELGLKESSAKLLPGKKTILFTSRAGIGDMAIMNTDGSTNQGFQSWIVKPDITDIYFLYSLGGNLKKQALRKASGSTFLEISNSEVKKLSLYLPDFKEQTIIGKIIQLIDKIITLQQRKVKLINKLKNALLTHFISKTSSQSASKTLKDITNIRGGYAFKSSEFTKSGFPVIKIANISQNGEIEGPYSYVLSLKSDYQLAKNDIVLAMSGATTGKIARVNSNNIYLQNQRVGYFVNNHKIDYNYLYYLLISDQFKRQLERILISGAQPNVSASDIEKFKFVILKSKKQQSKISTLFKHIDYELKAGNNKIHTLIQIKQFLLQNMFI